MTDRYLLQDIEDQNTALNKSKYPDEFKSQQIVDNSERLRTIGVEIKDKKEHIDGYIKLWPEDFIVEEIQKDGSVCTIEKIEKEDFINHTENTKSQIVHATLVKCNLSTPEAVNELCRLLSCRIDQIGYAGIKDKNAITSQRISFRNISIKEIQSIKSEFFFLKNISYGKQQIQNGDLLGNRFTILIRKREGEKINEETLSKNILEISHNGFPNFFYTQRFGSFRLASHLWGEKILKGEYIDAIKEFLTLPYNEGCAFYKNLRLKALNVFGDWSEMKKIYEPFPIFFENEIKFLNYMEKNQDDILGGLKTIKDQVQLWVYAFASFLFNKKLSNVILSNETKEKLPLVYSNPDFYKDELLNLNIYPLSFDNIKELNFNLSSNKELETRTKVKFNKVYTTDKNILMEFDLGKGSYATSMLANIINIVSGPPNDFNKERIDIKKSLGRETAGGTLKFFSPIIGDEKERIQILSR